MIELAYIQKKDGEFINETAYTMWRGCQLRGIQTIPFTSEEINKLELSKNTLVHGWVPIVHRALSKLGVLDFVVPSVPSELHSFFGRKIWISTLGEIRWNKPQNLFIKPLSQHKLFVGHVTRGELKDLIYTAGYEDDLDILVSEVVNFISEYRLFIHNGVIASCRHYLGDFTKNIDFDVAYKCIEAYASAPIGYALDMGVTDDGRTLPVEVNDAFSLGSYGMLPVPYSELIEDRWTQIVSRK